MTQEYPWKKDEGIDEPRKNLDDFGIGKAVENVQKRIDQEETRADNSSVPYTPNLDAMYYIVLCGFASYFRLNPIETEVLCFVASFHRKGLSCYASKELIAKVARTSSVTVFKTLKNLKERRLIEQHYHEGVIHLKLGPEAVDRWKYHEKLIETSKSERKNLRKPKNIW